MKIHEVKRKTKLIKRPRVGRGGKRGKTSGKGHKGQKSRAGHKIRPEIRDIIKKIPKLRGRGVNSNKSISRDFSVIKISDINDNYKDGEKVTKLSLFEKKLIRKIDGKFPKVKIVGPGELNEKLTFVGVKFTNKLQKSSKK